MKRFKLLIKYVLYGLAFICSCVLGYVGWVFIYAKINEFKPNRIDVLTNIGGNALLDTISKEKEYSLISWNIGYGAMGAESDFFYDGGTMMQPSKDYYSMCFDSIKEIVRSLDADFIFLQEVDSFAKRSYYNNQIEGISCLMPNYNAYFAKNYSVKYVPLPLFNPTGVVEAGLLTMSKFKVQKALRLDLETSFPFPENLFILKRCIMVCRMHVSDNKELVLINVHNSAFDEGGEIRDKESKIIATFAMSEYDKGNYVIMGGDWNMNPSNYNAFNINNGDKAIFDFAISDSIYIRNNWGVYFDKKTPTNRAACDSYKHGVTSTTIYDFFITSPNIIMLWEETTDQQFMYADHNMITIKFKLI